MAKKVKRTSSKLVLAAGIRTSLQEALKYARGEKTDVIVRRVVPGNTDAHKARMPLGLAQRSGRA